MELNPVHVEFGAMVLAQQFMMTAILASRFDATKFEQTAAEARTSLEQLGGASPAAKLYLQHFDELLSAFRGRNAYANYLEGKAH